MGSGVKSEAIFPSPAMHIGMAREDIKAIEPCLSFDK